MSSTASRLLCLLILTGCRTPGSSRQAALPAQGAGGSLLHAQAEGAILFDDLGDHHFAITTGSPEAQLWFDQGMRFYWAFNHPEAFRSFAKATDVDPSCAMCWWGASLAFGPNYNESMLQERVPLAWVARAKAIELASNSKSIEQFLIRALAVRYGGPKVPTEPEQKKLNLAYSQAMRDVASRYPGDAEVLTLFAESLMNLNPWKLWTLDGKPAEDTLEIVAVLETALQKNPTHPGAHHLYIHALEASARPEKALHSAEWIGTAMPAAGHLVHMPAHIFQRLGRSADAAEANRRAIRSDLAYLGATHEPGHYAAMYTSHNYQFLAFSAGMEGRSEESIQAARGGAKYFTDHFVEEMPFVEFYLAQPIVMLARFGRWDDVLKEPKPRNASQKTDAALESFARGLAFVAKHRIDEAEKLLAELKDINATIPNDALSGQNLTRDLLAVAVVTLEGKIHASRGRVNLAISLLKDAAKKEDLLAYDEPPDWFYPVRPVLGALLLKTNRASQAEAVYRADLAKYPANGWSLFGLIKALEAQKKKAELPKLKKQFANAWSQADFTLASSAF